MTHWRFALGVCMLSAGILVGSAGGAIASADPDPDGSTADSQSVDGSSQDVSSATGSVESTADTGTSDSPSNSNQEKSASSPGPMIMSATTNTEESAATYAGAGVAAATKADTDGSGSTPVVSSEDTSNPDVVGSHSTVVAPSADVVASNPNVIAPDANPFVSVRIVVHPVTNAVATVANAVKSIPVAVLSLPRSATPTMDVITAVQDLLTPVAAAGIQLAQLPSDLASLLGFPGMAPGGIAGMSPGRIGGSLYAGGPSGAVEAPVLLSSPAQWPQILVAWGNWGVPSAGDVAGHPTVGRVAATGSRQGLSASRVAPVAPETIAPTGVLSILRHTISAFLAPASLTALAALGLPGIGGLLIISAAGVRVGYRQAKAASTLRAVGIAQFARLGPLGVVRSGSLVALRPRASSVVRNEPSRAASLLEPVA